MKDILLIIITVVVTLLVAHWQGWRYIRYPKDKLRKAPFTNKELRAAVDSNGWLVTWIVVDVSMMVEKEFDQVLDTISEAVIGSDLLTDIGYRAVDVTADGMIVLEVMGDANMQLDRTPEV